MLKSASSDESEVAASHLLFPSGERVPEAPPGVEVFNAPLMSNLDTEDRFTYHGRPHRIPKLPWTAGAALFRLEHQLPLTLGRLDTAQKANDAPAAMEVLETLAGELEELLDYVWRNARARLTWNPLSWFWWLQYQWRNPFAEATLGEVFVFLGFFSGCRMKHSGVVLESFDATRTRTRTSRPWRATPR